MKTIIHKILPAGLGVLATLPALAIEPPKDDAPPPPSVKTPASAPTKDPTARPDAVVENNNAFIGLITADIPEMLAAHIGTKAGEGVMIRDLAPGGPAEKAGFEKYDIVTRVGGKSVGSPAELSQRIAESKPGDEVSIDLIHEGKPAAKMVKLETRPASAGRLPDPRIADPRKLGHLDFDSMPEDQADRLREMIEGRMKGLMREQEQGNAKNRGNFEFKSDSLFRLMDNDGSVEMKSNDGRKEITVRDHQNNVTWSGPWDTEADKSAAPPEIRERIERFKFDEGFRGGGFRLRMGGAPKGPAGEEE